MERYKIVFAFDVGKAILRLGKRDTELRAKILNELFELSCIGLDMLKSKRLEFIEDKIYALRIFAQFNSIRIYMTPLKSEFICFYIFDKKSNRIPQKDLKVIRNRYRRIMYHGEI